MKFIEKWPNCSGHHHLWLRHLKILKVKIQDKTNKVIFLPCWQVVQYEMAHEKPKLLILNPLDWGYFKAEHNYSLLWAYKYGFFASMVLPFFFLPVNTDMYVFSKSDCTLRSVNDSGAYEPKYDIPTLGTQ